jgi:hypothetical protein
LQNHVARLNLLAERGRDARLIEELDQDGQVAVGKGGGNLVKVRLPTGQIIASAHQRLDENGEEGGGDAEDAGGLLPAPMPNCRRG